jgi:MFS family permease
MSKDRPKKNIALLIIVASLGYFVDIYDLILFNIIKKESLDALSIDFLTNETVLFRWQMAGMLMGGLIWGILGDKKGRVSVLFGSILIYSIANIANAFVTSLEAYKVWRFIAGLGLAGELGAAITLVAELMPIKKRGVGTMIIVTFGALGAVAAFLVADKGEIIGEFITSIIGKPLANWQVAYIVGGVLGLVLLVLRAGTFESNMFAEMQGAEVKKGNFFSLFKTKDTFLKYLACIVIGLPVWFVVGILIALARNHRQPKHHVRSIHQRNGALELRRAFFRGPAFRNIISVVSKQKKSHTLQLSIHFLCNDLISVRACGLCKLLSRLSYRFGNGNRLLGPVCHQCQRAIWHQYSQYRFCHSS